jgi:hypothetical protein
MDSDVEVDEGFEGEDEEDVLQGIVKSTKGKRLAVGTQKNYAAKQKALRLFIVQHDHSVTANDISSDDDLVTYINSHIQVVENFIASNSYKQPETQTGLNATSTISGYICSVKNLYKKVKDPELRHMPEEMETSFADYSAGFVKTTAQAAEDGLVKQTHGKLPLTVVAYKSIASKALQVSGRSSTFAHVYGLLAWNLVQRAVTVAGIHTFNISWKDDALMIHISRHKGDQTGSSAFARHLYANPTHVPECCPVLGMAMYLFTGRFRGGNGAVRLKLFEETEKTYSKWLRDRLRDGTLTVDDLCGCRVEDLGTHSYRKGATTFADSCPGGPSGTAVNLRAGWREGRSRERYTFPTDGQDQYLGRMLSLLPIVNIKEFCILPPHFHHELDVRYRDIMTNDAWEVIIPAYSTFPEGFKTALRFMLASLVFAYKQHTLERILNPMHPLFSSRVYTGGYLEQLKDVVIEPKCRLCKDCGMTVTGIPVHWWTHLDSLESVLTAVEGVSQQLKEMPEKVTTLIERRVEIGAQHLTPNAVESIIAPLKQQLDSVVSHLSQQQQRAAQPAVVDNSAVLGYDSDDSVGGDKPRSRRSFHQQRLHKARLQLPRLPTTSPTRSVKGSLKMSYASVRSQTSSFLLYTTISARICERRARD